MTSPKLVGCLAPILSTLLAMGNEPWSRASEVVIVPFESTWRFLNAQGEEGDPALADAEFEDHWFTPDYDDMIPIEWSGPSASPFAYGDIVAFDGLGTELMDPGEGQRFTAYFRHSFTTIDQQSNLFVDFVADDGVVFYLDGQEVARDTCCFDDLGDQVVDGYFSFADLPGFEDTVRRLPMLDGQSLPPGQHVLAVSVHQVHPQVDPTSDDLGFDMRLISRDEADFTLIAPDTKWRFFRGVSEPSDGIQWTESSFDDQQWEFANEGLGYDFDIDTLPFTANVIDTGLFDMFLEYTSLYMRKPFSVPNPSRVNQLELTLDYDDSFIAYINGVEVARSDFGVSDQALTFDSVGDSHESTNGVPDAILETFEIDLDQFPDLLRPGADNVLAIHGLNRAIDSSDFIMAEIALKAFTGGQVALEAGDANQDLQFDQLDLVKVQIASKYLSGQAATWGDGDWNAAPGGSPGNPPIGDGVFDQLDIVRAQVAGVYLTGPYSALSANGQSQDGQTSMGYDPSTGELWVDAPAGAELTSVNIDSETGIFTAQAATNLGGSFDNDDDRNIFKATFGASFGTVSFGNVAQTGLSESFLLADLSAVGSLAGGGALGEVDLIYVPEPATWMLCTMFVIVWLHRATVFRVRRL